MNLIKKQGLINSIALYIGVALGFFNLIILFQRHLTIDQIGYFNLLTAITVVYAQVSSLGTANVVTRYFPYFKTEDNKHKGFPVLVGLCCLIGFTIVTLVFLLSSSFILRLQKDQNVASLTSQYYHYIILIAFFVLAFSIQEAFSKAVFKSVVPSILREVILKVFTSIGVLLIAFGWLDYKGFLNFYLLANVFILASLSIYNARVKAFRLSRIDNQVRTKTPEMLRFGLFVMLGGSSFALIQNLDIIILKLLTSEAAVGYYGVFFMIASVINLPAKAFSATSYQLVADAWKNNDLKKIGNIYRKTSIVQFILGTLMFVGLVINKHNILFLLIKPDKPYYALYFNVFIIIGLSFLVDITGGLNSAIISFSKHYKFVMRSLIAAVFICCLLNFLLIPVFGLTGAGLAYLFTLIGLNFVYWFFIKLKMGLQPFDKRYIVVAIVALGIMMIGYHLPKVNYFLLDVFYRSAVVTILYVIAIYFLKISEDINDLINKVLMKKP